MRLWSSAPILQALPCTVPYLQPFIVCLSAASEPERRFGSPMLPSVLEHTLTIVCFCGIILAQELVLLSMIVGAIQLYHRRTFSCSLFVTHVLYLNTAVSFSRHINTFHIQSCRVLFYKFFAQLRNSKVTRQFHLQEQKERFFISIVICHREHEKPLLSW